MSPAGQGHLLMDLSFTCPLGKSYLSMLSEYTSPQLHLAHRRGVLPIRKLPFPITLFKSDVFIKASRFNNLPTCVRCSQTFLQHHQCYSFT
ncbi:hypothetical protein PoB_001078800 [Plakobranchus ocellatus]|uniref:Uncharacterized protein n=1 Tax=Plakobranchus ocellatus TaxID=259542 RepID=A0AAV3YPL7_9GAST|nr:hypothetical protein PoB_001078800 [Plakobranchus ocellatus]